MCLKARSCSVLSIWIVISIFLLGLIGAIAVLLYSSWYGVQLYTRNGLIRGTILYDSDGCTFYAFQSIPYAKPPIGERRFKSPELSDPWDGILDATQDIPMCPQFVSGRLHGTEDCLYLNIYTSQLPSEYTKEEQRHVMVYIHGGGFTEGSATINMYGPHYFMTQNIILVVLNYRLGALGFVNMDESDISSNNGFKDQHLAMKWVKNNIEDYGGNPNNITLFSHSAGAIAAHYQMLAPQSKDLFHRVIIQSGSATCTISTGKTNTALLLAEKLGLKTDNITKMVDMLRLTPTKIILEAQHNVNWELGITEDWIGGPIIEGNHAGSIISQDAHDVLNRGTFEKLPLLIGTTSKEGILVEIVRGFKGITGHDIDIEVPKDLSKNYTSVIRDRILQYYFGNNSDLNVYSENQIRLWTDVNMKYYTVSAARKHAEYGPVYLYEFVADTKLNYMKQLNPISAKRTGAVHGDELAYLFKGDDWEIAIEPGSIEDVSIRRMVKMWTNFAKYGKPIIETDSLLNANWISANQNSLNYMKIGENLIPGVYNYDGVAFWDSIYEQYGGSNKI